MFSAVYLVCVLNQECIFFVDKVIYPSIEVCQTEAKGIVENNQVRAMKGEAPPHTAEYQCVAWDKA